MLLAHLAYLGYNNVECVLPLSVVLAVRIEDHGHTRFPTSLSLPGHREEGPEYPINTNLKCVLMDRPLARIPRL